MLRVKQQQQHTQQQHIYGRIVLSSRPKAVERPRPRGPVSPEPRFAAVAPPAAAGGRPHWLDRHLHRAPAISLPTRYTGSPPVQPPTTADLASRNVSCAADQIRPSSSADNRDRYYYQILEHLSLFGVSVFFSRHHFSGHYSNSGPSVGVGRGTPSGGVLREVAPQGSRAQPCAVMSRLFKI